MRIVTQTEDGKALLVHDWRISAVYWDDDDEKYVMDLAGGEGYILSKKGFEMVREAWESRDKEEPRGLPEGVLEAFLAAGKGG